MSDEVDVNRKKRLIEAKHILLIAWLVCAVIVVISIASPSLPKGPSTTTVTVTTTITSGNSTQIPTLNSYVYNVGDFLTSPIGFFFATTTFIMLVYIVVRGMSRY